MSSCSEILFVFVVVARGMFKKTFQVENLNLRVLGRRFTFQSQQNILDSQMDE